MGNAPDRIWLAVEPDRIDRFWYHEAPVDKHHAVQDVEYVLNTPEAMRNAGYVPAEMVADLRAEITRALQQLEMAQKEAKAFSGNATDNYNRYLQAADDISQLKLQLATARNDALEEAAKAARDAVFDNGPYEVDAVSDAVLKLMEETGE